VADVEHGGAPPELLFLSGRLASHRAAWASSGLDRAADGRNSTCACKLPAFEPSRQTRWLTKAMALDLIRAATLYKAQVGEDQHTFCLTMEEARQESEGWVRPVKGWLPRRGLNLFWHGSEEKKVKPFLRRGCRLHIPAKQIRGVDGIWWDDSYDPGNLSAPRSEFSQSR